MHDACADGGGGGNRFIAFDISRHFWRFKASARAIFESLQRINMVHPVSYPGTVPHQYSPILPLLASDLGNMN